MKKLKLNLSKVEGTEMLSREQLRQVMGGDDGSGGSGEDDGVRCYTGSCSLFIQGSDGNYVERSGTCAISSATPYFGFRHCYCDVGLGEDVHVTSNGGVSRCTIQ